ncbi:hypothetical protein [Streptomyces herbicida]|uniref:hypothetical protein n=1 Tax=Streptomyces herbicida TaxID=3065675 RepID=UPI00292EDCDC|nr:hypothetical protein [Streptomyces sp. NEAU-HV9]
MELDGVPLESGPVLGAGVDRRAQPVQGAGVVRLWLPVAAALFLGADEGAPEHPTGAWRASYER